MTTEPVHCWVEEHEPRKVFDEDGGGHVRTFVIVVLHACHQCGAEVGITLETIYPTRERAEAEVARRGWHLGSFAEVDGA
jgi:hypothetical protein